MASTKSDYIKINKKTQTSSLISKLGRRVRASSGMIRDPRRLPLADPGTEVLRSSGVFSRLTSIFGAPSGALISGFGGSATFGIVSLVCLGFGSAGLAGSSNLGTFSAGFGVGVLICGFSGASGSGALTSGRGVCSNEDATLFTQIEKIT